MRTWGASRGENGAQSRGHEARGGNEGGGEGGRKRVRVRLACSRHGHRCREGWLAEDVAAGAGRGGWQQTWHRCKEGWLAADKATGAESSGLQQMWLQLQAPRGNCQLLKAQRRIGPLLPTTMVLQAAAAAAAGATTRQLCLAHTSSPHTHHRHPASPHPHRGRQLVHWAHVLRERLAKVVPSCDGTYCCPAAPPPRLCPLLPACLAALSPGSTLQRNRPGCAELHPCYQS